MAVNLPLPTDAFMPSSETVKVLAEVGTERASHARRGFDNDHDDHEHYHVHGLTDLAHHYASRGGFVQRADLVKAASLMIAAIERFDRSEAVRR